jgi:hypothetical protein
LRRLAAAASVGILCSAVVAAVAGSCGGQRGGGSTAPSSDAASVASSRDRQPLVGIVRDGRRQFLVRLRPGTLRATSGRLPVGTFLGQAAWAPDRRRVALAVRPPGRIDVVGVAPMQPAVRIDTHRRLDLAWLAWTTRRRLLAVSRWRDGGHALSVIDPVARRVLRRTWLSGWIVGEAVPAAGRGLAMLLAPNEAIGATELAIVSPTGTVRGLPLPAITAGEVAGRQRAPALAVDRAGRRAYVVSATESKVVEVDLVSGRTIVHDLARARTVLDRLRDLVDPPAQAKGAEGPVRHAALVDAGVLAVSGCDETPDGDPNACDRPYGLRLIDTRRWTSRTIDPRASRFWVAQGVVVVDAYGYGEGKRLGLRAFGADGDLRVSALRGRDVVVQIDAHHVYAHIVGSPRGPTHVIDLRTARTSLLPARIPYLIPAPPR